MIELVSLCATVVLSIAGGAYSVSHSIGNRFNTIEESIAEIRKDQEALRGAYNLLATETRSTFSVCELKVMSNIDKFSMLLERMKEDHEKLNISIAELAASQRQLHIDLTSIKGITNE